LFFSNYFRQNNQRIHLNYHFILSF
jgi:hypothetical protein